MPDPSPRPRPLRLAQAASILQVNPAVVRRWVDAGHLKAIRLPFGHRERMIDWDDCMRLRESYKPAFTPDIEEAASNRTADGFDDSEDSRRVQPSQ